MAAPSWRSASSVFGMAFVFLLPIGCYRQSSSVEVPEVVGGGEDWAGKPSPASDRSSTAARQPSHQNQFASLQDEVLEMFGNSWVAHRKRTAEHPDNSHLPEEQRDALAWLWAVQWETTLNFYNDGLQIEQKGHEKARFPCDWTDENQVHSMVRIVEPEIMTLKVGQTTVVFETWERQRRRMDE